MEKIGRFPLKRDSGFGRSAALLLIISLTLWQTPLVSALTEQNEDIRRKDPKGRRLPLQAMSPPGRKLSETKASKPKYVPGELIVKLKEGYDLTSLEALNQKYSVTPAEKIFQEVYPPQEVLKGLKSELASLSPEHQSWYWWADQESK